MWRSSLQRSQLSIAAFAAIVLSACAPVSSGGEAVQIDLIDFGISAEPAVVAAGSIDLAIANDGQIVHEVEIFGGAFPDQELEISNSVADTTGLDLIDEVEDVLPSTTARLTVELEPGTYLVICNLPGHYAKGMSTSITVEPEGATTQP
jgi:uncharacterized cupredoxin-like copper-binding protein